MPVETYYEMNSQGQKIEVTKWHCGCESYVNLALPKGDPHRGWTFDCPSCAAVNGPMSELMVDWDRYATPLYRRKRLTYYCVTCKVGGLDYYRADTHIAMGDKVQQE